MATKDPVPKNTDPARLAGAKATGGLAAVDKKLLRRQCDTRYYLGATLVIASVAFGAAAGSDTGIAAECLSKVEIAAVSATAAVSGALAAAWGLRNRP